MCKWPWVTSTTIKASFTGKWDQFKKLKKSFVQSWYKGRHSRPIMGWKRMWKMTLGGWPWPDQSYESAPSYLGRRRTCYQSQPVRYRPLSWNWQSIPDVFFNGHWQESSLHVGLVKKIIWAQQWRGTIGNMPRRGLVAPQNTFLETVLNRWCMQIIDLYNWPPFHDMQTNFDNWYMNRAQQYMSCLQ